MCEICEFIEQGTVALHGYLPTNPLRGLAWAFICGFARGFNLRQKTTYLEFCPEHADMMKDALLAAGAEPIPITMVCPCCEEHKRDVGGCHPLCQCQRCKKS